MADEVNNDTRSDGEGHRARLRQRLLGGGEDLHDYEIVEYLLALAIPRRDTKALAKELLRVFGSLASLITADAASIAQVKGMGETSTAALKIVQIAALRLLHEPVQDQPLLASWSAVLDYLKADMAHLTTERVRVLYINSRNMLIRNENMSDGSVAEAVIYPREVIKRALDLGAVAVILVHNHPSGDPSPSKADIAVTRNIMEAGRHLGIVVHDHVIIGKSGIVSLKAKGVI